MKDDTKKTESFEIILFAWLSFFNPCLESSSLIILKALLFDNSLILITA